MPVLTRCCRQLKNSCGQRGSRQGSIGAACFIFTVLTADRVTGLVPECSVSDDEPQAGTLHRKQGRVRCNAVQALQRTADEVPKLLSCAMTEQAMNRIP